MKFSLHAGLVLRHGQKTLEIVRQLGDDEYRIEDCLTRRPSTIDRLTLLKRIWSKTYEIVLPAGSEAAAAKMPPDGVRIDFGSLKREVRVGIDRRKQYIDALQKGHVTRGQRARVAVIIAKVGKRINDPKPPSASTVMTWARDYQTTGHNPFALRNGNACRIRKRQIAPVMDGLVSKMIRTVYLTGDRHSLTHTLDCIKREAKQLVAEKRLEAASAKISLATLSRRVQEIDYSR